MSGAVQRWRRLLVGLGVGLALPALAAGQPASGAWLGELSWPEAERWLAEDRVVILPFGPGAKEHGPQLPLNADAVVMDYLCREAVRARPVLVAPPILHGWLPAFREFPGTEVGDAEVFRRYVEEVALSLVRHGARRIVLLNTSISRASGLPLAIAARELRARHGVAVLLVSWDDLESEELRALEEQPRGGHADEIETSIHLFLQPERVRLEVARPQLGREPTAPLSGYRPGVLSRDPDDPDYSPDGVFGDPTLASAEKGRRALELMTREWLRTLELFAAEPLPAQQR